MGRPHRKTLSGRRRPPRKALRAWSRPLGLIALSLLVAGCTRGYWQAQVPKPKPTPTWRVSASPGEVTASVPRSFYPDLLKPPLPDVEPATASAPPPRTLALLKPPMPGEEPPEALWAGPPLTGPPPSAIEALPADGQTAQTTPPSVTTTPEPKVLLLANRPDNPRKVVLNFDEADIRAVIRVIAELVGINYVLDPNVKGAVTIQTAGKIPVEDLLPTLAQILAVNNFALVEVGGLYRIVPAAQARQLPIATRLGRLARGVPAEERFIIQIIPVRFIPAATMQEVVKPVVSKAAAMVPVRGTNSFILVDSAHNVKKALRVVELLDISTFDRVQTKLYALEHVDPETMAKDLDKMFKALGYGDKAAAPLEFIPIPRLNALLVVNGLPDLAPSIELWTSRLDQPVLRPEEQTFVHYIQHGDAENIATILQSLFRPSEAAAKAQPAPAPVEPGRRKIISPKVEGPAETGVTAAAPAPMKPTGTTLPSGEGPAVAAAEEIFLFVVADTETNALIFRTKPVHYPDVLAVIKKLDRKPKQVIIETLIAEVSLKGELQFGLEYAFRGTDFSKGMPRIVSAAQLGTPLEAPGGLPLPTGTAAAATSGGLSLFVTNPNRFLAMLDTLARDQNLNILSSPSILTSENKPAEINVVTEVPISRTTIDPATNQTRTDFEFREVGVKLNITPKINEDRFVTLDIEEELSEVSTEAGRGARVVGDVEIPSDFISREAKTSVIVKDNQSLVIGGLISEKTSETLTGIPILNRIPLLKHIFGKTVTEKRKTELLVMVTPRVVVEEDDARALTDLYNERLQGIQRLLKERKEQKAHWP